MHATLSTPDQAAQWLRTQVRGTLGSDSRTLGAGDGFVATPGSVVDGRTFVPRALEQGVAACLVEAQGVDAFGINDDRVAAYAGLKRDAGAIAAAFFDHPSKHLDLLAITGTNGKTSCAWWLAQALSALPAPWTQTCAVVGTLGVGQPPLPHRPSGQGPGNPLAALRATGMTTPDAVSLQAALHQLMTQGLQACALEASSIGIEEGRLNGLHVRVAVFTNFTQDHLDYHGSMEAYWAAKRRLFHWSGLQCAVVNIDDAHGATLARELATGTPALDLWTTSIQGAARLQARNITHTTRGLRFEVAEAGQTCRLQSQVIGHYNVSNLLNVVAVMRALGADLATAVQTCELLRPVPGRLECLGGEGAPLIVVDYAHTPDALAQTLDALRPLAQQRAGQLWCVFGCGGDRDAAKRPLMGAIAAAKADHTVVTSDNPRSEKPASIVAQILAGMAGHPQAEVQVDRSAAILGAIRRAAACDVVLLAGKGHEETQEIDGVKKRFSDRTHALEALAQRKGPEVHA
jgi:UDP-N-acetylmuramoyl-L-alanyl-D-glutamate--2,6-diaminopimelate ligase